MADPAAEEAFSALYTASYRRVLSHAYALTGDLTDAHDVCQEAYAKLWPRWSKVRYYDDPVAWLLRVAHNIAMSRWRRAKVATKGLLRLTQEAARAPEVAEPSAESESLVAAMRQLPEGQRRALALHYLADRPIASIAAIEGVAEGTIKARLSRGRVALAEILGEQMDPAEGGVA